MGPKLITSVQYESGFDGLNEVRPLSLTDEVRCDLTIPFFNLQTVSEGKPADGRFLQCTDSGVLIVQRSNSKAKNYNDSGPRVFGGDAVQSYILVNRSMFVVFWWATIGPATNVFWCTPSGEFLVMGIKDDWVFCPYAGSRFYFRASGTGGTNFRVRIQSFY